ncbi:PREDICTED: uncharacterized protein LOC108375541 [Rhagoletis zephyria]|uniref:uncharacterized protein LOC108375541 n=1 Tax=Rhagoletis zephyria TaxID=28612 RepID=UPI00081154D0|nr:PREDICTED: uncharacterized protein LOC108375541 [Rhagoletis zephyria]XP_017487172.1 PREDICTED: uncharacterized protein LOC108375541 [Rhagoletis zephyria]XP_017487173.1 PREDICTED: uncharacterized protein LOC108375541 [Rhagoletis zephyria]XP_036340894.1 uncharacterized protein LOC118750278 [Rhagoletis pomonella]XP_036340895.1 uncharacterized protein LOC118750278 [Rhagoletis pomonella]
MPFSRKGKANDRRALIENDQILYRGNAIDDGDSVNDSFNLSSDYSDEDDINCMPVILPPMENKEASAIVQMYSQVSNAPPDRFNFTYAVFYLLGIATMTPWNFFITAEDVS